MIKFILDGDIDYLNKWLPLINYIDLQNQPAIPFRNKDFLTVYSNEDSLRLQWLANSKSNFSYSACLQLRYVYPFANCDDGPLITGLTNHLNTENFLGQNSPNPMTKETIIPLFIPFSQSGEALLEVRELKSGDLIKSVPIIQRGDIKIKMDLEIPAGIYIYSLLIDRKKVSTKKMAVIK